MRKIIRFPSKGSVPKNSSVPTISGTAQAGLTLTASTGTWTQNPTSFTYQWKRAGTPLSGATASTYIPVTGDVGSTLTVSVVATNSKGSSSPATSAATSAVAAAGAVPVNTVLPAISGAAQVGQTLTTTTGTWTNSPSSFTYVWKRAGTPISGATASTYVPVAADVASAITVAVTAINGAGASSPATSAATLPVASIQVFLSTIGSDAAAGTAGAPVQTVSRALALCETSVLALSPAASYCRLVYLSDQYTLPAGLTTQKYVSTTGNDGNPGTIGSPYLTLQHAFDGAVAGQEILIRGGTYASPAGGVGTPTSAAGTITNPISIHNYPGERVIIDGAGVSASTDMVVIRGPYIYVQGLEIANNAGGSGLSLYNRANNYFGNNYIHDNWQNGVSEFYDSGLCSNHTVIGNVIYRNNKSNSIAPHPTWGSAVGGDRSNAWMIKGNIVTQNWGEGIGVYSSSNDVIDNNIVGDNFAGEIYSNNAGSRTITNNYIFNNNLASFQLDNGDSADMIPFSRESAAPASIPLNNEIVSGNICDGGARGLSYFDSGTAGGITNSTFNNNIFANAATADISIQADAGATGNTLTKNTFYDLSGAMVAGSASGFTRTNNRWYSGSSGAFVGSGDVTSDPIPGATPTPTLTLVVSGLGSGIGEIQMKGQALLMLYTIRTGGVLDFSQAINSSLIAAIAA